MSTLANFVPPCPPSFAWDVTDQYSTIQDLHGRGHRATRPRRNIKLRIWELRWLNADDATAHYIRGFAEQHLGAAVAFCFPLPQPNLYTPGPAVNLLTLAQAGGGSLADGTYDVQYTYENASGETLASPIQQIVISGGGGSASITVTAPNRLAADATLFGIYAELNPSTPTKQGTIATPAGTLSITSIAAGGALPTVNAMAGNPQVNGIDEPKYNETSAGVWQITWTLQELLA